MSKNYNQLSFGQRYQIESLLKAGMNQKMIAHQLEVHPSTISRELKRNIAKRGRTSGNYVASNAQRKTTLRHTEKAKHTVFTESMKQTIQKHLLLDRWSPELISKCSKVEMVSHERIYQWIWQCKHTNTKDVKPYRNLYQFLRHGRRRRKRGNRKDTRGIIPNRVPIAQRPLIVNKRSRLGDYELDFMMGKDHKGALLVMIDRATLHTRLRKLPKRTSSIVFKEIVKAANKNNYKPRTMTFDNDKAFSSHTKVAEAIGVKTYFTRPYTSQDKGSVENRIGVIRRFFPKKTNLTFVTNKQVRDVEMKINNRPVRKFNYLSPNQVLQKKIALIT